MAPVALPLLLSLLPAQAQAQPLEASETPLEEFTRIGKALYAGTNPVIGSSERARLEKALTNAAVTGVRRVRLLMLLSDEQLEQGDVELAIASLHQALEVCQSENVEDTKNLGLRIHRALGLANLRLA